MKKTPQFTRRASVLAVLAAIYPVAGYSQGAGQIEFAVGNVNAVAGNGQPRALKKGAEINAGDTLVTGDNGRAQIRFADGGYVSLQPNTRFRIDEYRYSGTADGSEKGFFSLVKGGLRAITGIIGKNNKSNYQVTTPVATIGIRGTHYTLRFCANDCAAGGNRITNGLYASVGEGQIVLANALGRLNLEQGQKGFVADPHTAPKPTDRPPLLTAPQGLKERILLVGKEKEEEGAISGNQVTDNGKSVLLQNTQKVLKPASGAIVADGGYGFRNFDTAVVDGNGQMVGYSLSTNPTVKFDPTLIQEANADQFIAWGRWTNGKTSPDAANSGNPLVFSSPQSLHYVMTANPTPTSAFTGTGTLTYTFMAGTSATSNIGSGAGVLGGGLTLTLATAGPASLNANFKVGYEGAVYNPIVNTTVSSAVFTGSTSLLGGGLSGCAASSCSVTINGVFAGANAERAGLVYQITDPNAPNSPVIHGAAVFKQ